MLIQMAINLHGLMAGLLMQAGLIVGVPTAGLIPPEPTSVTSCEMQEIYQGSEFKGCDADLEFMGLYIRDGSERMLISDKLDPETLKGQAILVHELVHFLQDKRDGGAPVIGQCMAANLEREAYEAGFEWLAAQLGTDRAGAIDYLEINVISLMMQTTCQRNMWEGN